LASLIEARARGGFHRLEKAPVFTLTVLVAAIALSARFWSRS
jgi:hypothetical protein